MSTADTVARYVRAPKTVALVAATVLAVVAGYATLTILSSQLAFLVVVVLGVSVPTTLDNYGLLPKRPDRVVLVTAAACLAHWALFLPLYVAVRGATSELVAAAAAFLATVVVGAAVGLSLQE